MGIIRNGVLMGMLTVEFIHVDTMGRLCDEWYWKLCTHANRHISVLVVLGGWYVNNCII